MSPNIGQAVVPLLQSVNLKELGQVAVQLVVPDLESVVKVFIIDSMVNKYILRKRN